MRRLADATENETCTIVDVENIEDKVNARLCELGLSCGQKIKIVAKSILKKVCLVEVREYCFSIRTSLLKDVLIK